MGTSVIIPVRNGAEFVASAIASALAQLDGADEIVVVDDASRDNTRQAVTDIADPRIKLLAGSGRGVSSARNIGLAAAAGEFIAFLDHDDMWPASRHEVMLRALCDKPEIDAVFGRIRVRFEEGARKIGRVAAMDGRYVGMVNLGTGLFRKRMLDRIDGFAEEMQMGEDTDFYIRLMEAGMRVELCDVDGLIYRRHHANTSNDLAAVQDATNDILMRRISRMRVRKTATGE
jgi:glycosyltransferase involved in cell wall biosynthesis